MIKSGEVDKIASEKGVRSTQIEKDYIIGWILKGISQNDYLSQHLVFKGGTVLRKVWFEDYRFSEDMDFTFIDDDFDVDRLEQEFKTISDWIYNESRITITIARDEGSKTQYKGYLSYQGPLRGEKTIKLDISTEELISYAVEHQVILDGYSDNDKDYFIKAYSLKESLAEKLRCVLQRSIPRDLYDIWYLIEYGDVDIDDVAYGFKDKSEHKGKDALTFVETMSKKEKRYQANWEKSLKHQINDLPEFDGVWRGIMAEAKKLEKLLQS